MRYSFFILAMLFTACKSPQSKLAIADTATNQTVAREDTVKFSEALVRDLYAKSDLVVRVQILNAVKDHDIYVVSANLITTYKGKPEATSPFKYEAFLEDGGYEEFYGKDLIIFLRPNKQYAEIYARGVHWGRTDSNVEFAYNDKLRDYILKLK